MIQLTDTQRQRLSAALEPLNKDYDPAEKMIRRPFSSPGYHTTLKGGWVPPDARVAALCGGAAGYGR